MTGPTINRPRAYDSIQVLRSSTGEPLPAPVLLELDTCDTCGSTPAYPFDDGTTICLLCWDQSHGELLAQTWPPANDEPPIYDYPSGRATKHHPNVGS